MKIGMISTYPPIHCGIATYSSYLIEELRRLRNRVCIVCHKGGKGLDCYPPINYEDTDLPHNAFKKCDYEEQIIEKALVEIADAIIVHEQYQKELIVGRVGHQDKIWVIPHGVREVKPVSKAKEELSLEDKKIILLVGYFRWSKNFERVVRIFPKVAESVDDALLLVASGVRRTEDIAYRNEFLEFVANSVAKDKIKVLLGPFSEEKFDLILSLADVAVFTYLSGAQSGIMAHCLAFAKPMVVSFEVQAMADLVQKTRSGLVARTDSELVEAIVTILTDKNLAKEFSDNARSYVEKHISWQSIASRHMDVYNKIQKNRHPSGGSCN